MRTPARRLAVLAAFAAFATGVSGYFMGLRQSGPRADAVSTPVIQAAAPVPDGVPVAPNYSGLRTHAHQPNAAWQPRVSDLAPAPNSWEGAPALSPQQQAEKRQLRESRRAFAGAPPVVPHPVNQQNSASCLACHGKTTRVAGLSVPQISHPAYTNCLQCHAAGTGPTSTWERPSEEFATPLLDNSFSGVNAPRPASRAFVGAPPVMSHPLWMRQNCISCHGAGGSSAIKPDHAARQNCVQCHATNSALEQRPISLEGTPIPVAPLP